MVLRSSSKVEIVDVAPGLWLWRVAHPHWNENVDWQQVVTSVCADVDGERWVIDPLLPSSDATVFWDRFAERPPTAVAVLLPDHMRETWDDPRTWSVDALVDRYGCRAFGPNAFDPDMGEAETDVRRIDPGQQLPGGVVPFSDPRGWHETPLWLPEHRALVVGDALTERDGVLRVWTSPTHEERALPALRSLLELPFERVIISHGEPVHSRDAFERALGARRGRRHRFTWLLGMETSNRFGNWSSTGPRYRHWPRISWARPWTGPATQPAPARPNPPTTT